MPNGMLARYGLENQAFPPDTIDDWFLAIEERYLEGICLAHEKLHGGLIYLFGYIAEMYLKCAICETIGLRLNDSVFDKTTLTTASSLVSNQMNLNPRHLKKHSLRHLANLLKTVRNGSGDPLPAALESALDSAIGLGTTGFADDWSEALRYRATKPRQIEIERTIKAIEWFRTNYSGLKG